MVCHVALRFWKILPLLLLTLGICVFHKYITGDYDFVSALRMAYDKGFRVILIHSTSLQV
jgi:hypothetical protein